MIEWKTSEGLVDYRVALDFMESRVAGIKAGDASEMLWFLEHPPLYTAGTSAQAADLIQPDRFPVHDVGRGGQYTYHGPGQRVVRMPKTVWKTPNWFLYRPPRRTMKSRTS